MALNVLLLSWFYSQSWVRKVCPSGALQSSGRLQVATRKKKSYIYIYIYIITMIIKIIVGKYPGAGLFSSPAKALILCTHFQGKEWGGKKKKKKEKRQNSGNCQNTCLLNRKLGGVWGREINVFLLLKFIPSFCRALKALSDTFKRLFIFSPRRYCDGRRRLFFLKYSA